MLDEVQSAGLLDRFVGGHPMAGTAHSGWSAGDADLFRGAPWVVSVDDHVDPEVWSLVMSLALDCGAFVVPARSDEHDAAAAAISHLPHLVAEALAITAGEVPLAFALAAGSFRDGTRVAATAPDLVRAMCEANAEQLLTVLDRTIDLLTQARDGTGRAGHRRRTRRGRPRGTHPLRQLLRAATSSTVDVGDENWRQQLAAAGRAGGVIRSVPPVRDSRG